MTRIASILSMTEATDEMLYKTEENWTRSEEEKISTNIMKPPLMEASPNKEDPFINYSMLHTIEFGNQILNGN